MPLPAKTFAFRTFGSLNFQLGKFGWNRSSDTGGSVFSENFSVDSMKFKNTTKTLKRKMFQRRFLKRLVGYILLGSLLGTEFAKAEFGKAQFAKQFARQSSLASFLALTQRACVLAMV